MIVDSMTWKDIADGLFCDLAESDIIAKSTLSKQGIPLKSSASLNLGLNFPF